MNKLTTYKCIEGRTCVFYKLNKGFTLVELLAVIVILAVVLAIAVPKISSLSSQLTINAFESDMKIVLKQLNYENIANGGLNVGDVNEATITNYGIPNANYASLSVALVDGKLYIMVTGKEKWNGLKACGTIKTIQVVPTTDEETCLESGYAEPGYIATKGVNGPVLTTGMTPIKWEWNDTEGIWSVVTTDENDEAWYDYQNKKWANARTADGSMWVWIPRYAYKITSEYNSSATGTISIKFLKGLTNEASDETTIETSGYVVGTKDTSMHYFKHPAFKFGEEEIPGFWVAKFNPTAVEGVAPISVESVECDGTDNDPTKTVLVASNEEVWVCINTKNAYNVSLDMKDKTAVYGWSANEVDTHMMKNSEWGAAVYLSKSTYGANEQKVWYNAYFGSWFITGCSSTSAESGMETECVEYNTENGVNASTTHTIYGIYDMNGIATIQVMGNYNDIIADSGFSVAEFNAIPSKYIDKYITDNEDLFRFQTVQK